MDKKILNCLPFAHTWFVAGRDFPNRLELCKFYETKGVHHV